MDTTALSKMLSSLPWLGQMRLGLEVPLGLKWLGRLTIQWSSSSVAFVNLIMSIAILVILFLLLPWRRLRWALPMPWDIFRQISFANLRVVSPEPHAEDSERLGVHGRVSSSQPGCWKSPSWTPSASRRLNDARHVKEAEVEDLFRLYSFRCQFPGEDATLPLQELLEWVAKHPFTGYKGVRFQALALYL